MIEKLLKGKLIFNDEKTNKFEILIATIDLYLILESYSPDDIIDRYALKFDLTNKEIENNLFYVENIFRSVATRDYKYLKLDKICSDKNI